MTKFKVFLFFALSCLLKLTLVYGATAEDIKSNSLAENKNLLVAAIKLDDTTDLINKFLENLEKDEINIIFANAIEESTQDIYWFESLIRAQLYLYDKYQATAGGNAERSLIGFAINFYKMREHNFYLNIGWALKNRATQLWNKMPESIHLFYYKSFYLKNVGYSHCIYTAIKPDESNEIKNNNIWLWHDNNSVDGTSIIKSDIKKIYENGYIFDVALNSTYYKNMYYYMASTPNHEILGWDSSDAPSGHIWTMEFLDTDRVVFYQQNSLMCAAGYADDHRINVVGREIGKDVTKSSAECQWLVKESCA